MNKITFSPQKYAKIYENGTADVDFPNEMNPFSEKNFTLDESRSRHLNVDLCLLICKTCWTDSSDISLLVTYNILIISCWKVVSCIRVLHLCPDFRNIVFLVHFRYDSVYALMAHGKLILQKHREALGTEVANVKFHFKRILVHQVDKGSKSTVKKITDYIQYPS